MRWFRAGCLANHVYLTAADTRFGTTKDYHTMRTLITSIIAALVVPMAAAPSASAAIINGFTGFFHVDNWTFDTDHAGSYDITDEPNSITLIGSDSEVFLSSVQTTYTISNTTGMEILLSFDWDYETEDVRGPFYDLAGYAVAGVETPLSDPFFGADTQSGSVIDLLVAPGQTFAFYVVSFDNWDGPAQITISNFTAVLTPEPSPALLLLAAGLMGVLRRRRGI